MMFRVLPRFIYFTDNQAAYRSSSLKRSRNTVCFFCFSLSYIFFYHEKPWIWWRLSVLQFTSWIYVRRVVMHHRYGIPNCLPGLRYACVYCCTSFSYMIYINVYAYLLLYVIIISLGNDIVCEIRILKVSSIYWYCELLATVRFSQLDTTTRLDLAHKYLKWRCEHWTSVDRVAVCLWRTVAISVVCFFLGTSDTPPAHFVRVMGCTFTFPMLRCSILFANNVGKVRHV